MPTVQVSQLHTDILELLDATSGGRYPTTLLNRRINLAQEKLHAILAKAGGDDDWLTYTVGLVVNPANSPTSTDIRQVILPTLPLASPDDVPDYWLRHHRDNYTSASIEAPGIYRLRDIRIVEGYTADDPSLDISAMTSWSGRSRSLQRCSLRELDEYPERRDWSYANPPRYRLVGPELVFDRRSATGAGFLISFLADITTLDTSDYLAIPPLWSEFIVADVVANLSIRNRDADMVSYFRGEAQRLADQILTTSQPRDEHEPPRIREVDGYADLGDERYRDRITFYREGW